MPLPTKRGDIIILNKEIVHPSLSNVSEQIRWSFDLRYNPIGQSTDREAFPGFVARSKAKPESQFPDPDEWDRLWLDCRSRMAKINQDGMGDVEFSRWAVGHPDCGN